MAAAVAQWEDMVSTKTYLTGGVGSRHTGEAFGDPYELPPDRAYCETCAAIASIMWNWRLLLASGDSRYADLLERTLYNGFPCPAPRSTGGAFFYVNPLQSRGAFTKLRRSVESGQRLLPAEHHAPHRLACINTWRPATRAGSSYTSTRRAMRRATAPDGEPIELRVRTGYPWEGEVEVEVVDGGADPWTCCRCASPRGRRPRRSTAKPSQPKWLRSPASRLAVGRPRPARARHGAATDRLRTRASTRCGAAWRWSVDRSCTASSKPTCPRA